MHCGVGAAVVARAIPPRAATRVLTQRATTRTTRQCRTVAARHVPTAVVTAAAQQAIVAQVGRMAYDIDRSDGPRTDRIVTMEPITVTAVMVVALVPLRAIAATPATLRAAVHAALPAAVHVTLVALPAAVPAIRAKARHAIRAATPRPPMLAASLRTTITTEITSRQKPVCNRNNNSRKTT